VLYKFVPGTETGLTVQSQGKLPDQFGSRREPPYSVFLSSTGKSIVMMLYENIIKILPVTKDRNGKVIL